MHIYIYTSIYIYIYTCICICIWGWHKPNGGILGFAGGSIHVYIYIYIYMIAVSGPVALPTPHPPGQGPPGFSAKTNDSVSIPCYGASSETISSGGAPERGFLTHVDGFLMGALLERVSQLRIFTKDIDICKMTHSHQMTTTILPTM